MELKCIFYVRRFLGLVTTLSTRTGIAGFAAQTATPLFSSCIGNINYIIMYSTAKIIHIGPDLVMLRARSACRRITITRSQHIQIHSRSLNSCTRDIKKHLLGIADTFYLLLPSGYDVELLELLNNQVKWHKPKST